MPSITGSIQGVYDVQWVLKDTETWKDEDISVLEKTLNYCLGVMYHDFGFTGGNYWTVRRVIEHGKPSFYARRLTWYDHHEIGGGTAAQCAQAIKKYYELEEPDGDNTRLN